MSEAVISIQNLSKTFGTNEVLKDISFEVKRGEVVTIIGSSGSGKSTLLRCVNLLEKPTSGEIFYNGQNILEHDKSIYEYRTHVGMVFQQFNLFNNLNVLENCIVGPMKVLKKSKEEAEKIAKEFLEKVGMSAYINAKPRQLSGGQKQRVAIARALSMQPDVLLFDEPTSALDPALRLEVEKLILQNKELGMTQIVVTHDLTFAENIADDLLTFEPK